MIEVIELNTIFANPRPELRSQGAWHPSLVQLGGSDWLCSFDIGQAPESHDYATHLSRSSDGGHTWTVPTRLLPTEPSPRATHSVRLGRLRDGRLLGIGARFLRDDPDSGLINHPGLGYTDMELIATASTDAGATWTRPVVLEPPMAGPFETCHPPLELTSGRILWPTSTWMRWDGSTPEGMRAVALVSDDGGLTWPSSLEVLDQWDRGIVTWEQSITQLADGRLLAAVWSLDVHDGTTLPTLAMLAGPADPSFGKPLATGIRAQTTKLASLGGRTVLAVYRRDDEPGLWGSVAHISDAGDRWETLSSVRLWSGARSGMDGRVSVGEELSALQFGYPSIVIEEGNLGGMRRAAVAFWCTEHGVTGIRLLRLRIDVPATGED